MQCVNHSDRAASVLCQRCDKTLCDDCVEERNGRRFCAPCAEYVDRRTARRPPPRRPAPPGAEAAGPPPPGDVYQGPAPAGDVYQGPAPAGDVYQGPAPAEFYDGPPSGGVYEGALPGSPGGAAAAPAATAKADFSVRGLLAGFIGVIIAAALYYTMYVTLDLRFSLFVVVMSVVVALTARLGAGRAGRDVGLIAAGLFVVSVFLGQYLVEKKFHEDMYAGEQIRRQAAAEIRIDGRYTEDEARRLSGYTPEEWGELGAEEREWLQEALRAEYQEARAEGWDPRDLYDYDVEEAGLAIEPTLTFGAYFGDLFFYLGFWGIFLLAFGCWQAYKIASTET